MSVIERSVTVSFSNQTSRTLYLTDLSETNDSMLGGTSLPGSIAPHQAAEWANKNAVFTGFSGYAKFKFSRIDNGEDGHVSISWSNPMSGSNEYTVTCDPSPLYGVQYYGGGGTNATVYVLLVERNLNLSYGTLLNRENLTYLCAADDTSSVYQFEGGDGAREMIDHPAGWGVIDLSTGGPWNGEPNKVVKILNAKTQRWLTVFSNDGNRLGLLAPFFKDYPDQHWTALKIEDGTQCYAFQNVQTGKMLVGYKDGRSFVYENLIPNAHDQMWIVNPR